MCVGENKNKNKNKNRKLKKERESFEGSVCRSANQPRAAGPVLNGGFGFRDGFTRLDISHTETRLDSDSIQ